MKRFLLTAVTVVFMQSALAQDYVLAGVGTAADSCGEWLKARREKNSINTELLLAWAQGYLSGMNLSQDGVDKIIILPRPTVIEAWFDKECKDDPVETLWIATLKLTSKVRVAQGKQPVK